MLEIAFWISFGIVGNSDKPPLKYSHSEYSEFWFVTANSSLLLSTFNACSSDVVRITILLHWFVSAALPLAAWQVIWWVRITTPVAFDSVWPSAICVSFACAWTNTITTVSGFTCLPKLHSSLAACSGICNYFCESFFHYGSIRYSHSKAMMGGGLIIV